MRIEQEGVWLSTKESLHLEEMAKEEDRFDLWEIFRLGNIAWLDQMVPDAGFETDVNYQHRYFMRWMRAEELCDPESEPINIGLNHEGLESVRSMLRSVIAIDEERAENFDVIMDAADKEIETLYADDAGASTEEDSEEEKAFFRAGMYRNLVKNIAWDKRLLGILDVHLQT